MQSVAGAWLVLQLSHNSALALALFGAFSYGPVLIFGLYAGTLVDRFAHRDVLLLTQLISLVGAGLYAALTATHVITLPIVLVLAAVLGVNQALYFPARQATVLEMVGRGELVSAVALNSIAFNLARIAGPALGGVVIATLGVAACFWINAITYLGVIAALLTIRRRPLTAGPPQTAVQLIAEALRYVARTPALAGLFALLFVRRLLDRDQYVRTGALSRSDAGSHGEPLLDAVYRGDADRQRLRRHRCPLPGPVRRGLAWRSTDGVGRPRRARLLPH